MCGKYFRNYTLEKNLIENLKRVTPRLGIHVTDLIYCLRKSYYRKIGKEGEETDESVLKKLRGKSLHSIMELNIQGVKEYQIEKDGIIGTIDVFGDRPTELLTTSSSPNKEPFYFSNKIRQLMAYCYMTGKNEGNLLIFFTHKPELRAYTLFFDKEDLERFWKYLKIRADILKNALETGEPPEGEAGFECRTCPYIKLCNNHR